MSRVTTAWLVVTLAISPATDWARPAALALPHHHAENRPGTTIEYRVERLEATTRRDLQGRFTATRLAVLEKLNRADVTHLGRLGQLVVPAEWRDELEYGPFGLSYPAAAGIPKLLIVDQAFQAFAAYEQGHLRRWGPVSSGRQTSPTPSGLHHLNWRSPGRHSTVNPRWFMKWYFNFENALGLALHSYALPGYPASHACIRLLERDATWIYEWGEGSTPTAGGEAVRRGTPLLIVGQYAFGAPPPWRSLENLARGIAIPDAPLPNGTDYRDVKPAIRRD